MKFDLKKKEDRDSLTELMKRIRHLELYSKAYGLDMSSCLLAAAFEAAKDELIAYLCDSEIRLPAGIDFQNADDLRYLDFDKSVH
jgi:energy-converting hydrogenase A subunit M